MTNEPKEGDRKRFKDGWYFWDGFIWVEEEGVTIGPREVHK